MCVCVCTTVVFLQSEAYAASNATPPSSASPSSPSPSGVPVTGTAADGLRLDNTPLRTRRRAVHAAKTRAIGKQPTFHAVNTTQFNLHHTADWKRLQGNIAWVAHVGLRNVQHYSGCPGLNDNTTRP